MTNLKLGKLDVEIHPYDDLDECHGRPSSPYYLRIGDTQFIVPPTAIRVENESLTNLIPILRSNSSLKMKAGRQVTMLTVELYFHNLTAINGRRIKNPLKGLNVDAKSKNKDYFYIDGLRSLIAQFRKTPFLPIENEYINNVLGIDAVSLANLEVQTVPDFPNTLKATLQMYKFNYHGYIPWIDSIVKDETAPLFKQIFNWPLFRWYYQRDMDDSTLIRGQVRDGIRFKILNEAELEERDDARRRLKKDRERLSRPLDKRLKEDSIHLANLPQDEQLLNRALSEYWQIKWIADKETGGDMHAALEQWQKTYRRPVFVRHGGEFDGTAIVLDGLQDAEIGAMCSLLDRIKDGKPYIYPEGSKGRTEADEKIEQAIRGVRHKERLRRQIEKSMSGEEYEEEPVKKTVDEIIAEYRDDQEELKWLEEAAAKTEADIGTIEIPTPGLFLRHMSISMRNIVTRAPLQIQEEPVQQYLGSQDVVISAQLYATNKETVAALRAMVERVNQMQLAYRDEIVPGFVVVENDLMRLFGVDSVVIERMSIDTTDSPDLWAISLVMIQFRRTQRDIEALDGILGNPVPNPTREDLVDIRLNSIRSQLLLQKRMQSINPYPDLNLPTWDEVRMVVNAWRPRGEILGRIGEVDAKWADPDFYIMTGHTLVDLLEMAINAGSSQVLIDSNGFKAEIMLPSDNGHAKIRVNEVFKQELERGWREKTRVKTNPNSNEIEHLEGAPPELAPKFTKEPDGMYSFESPIFQLNQRHKFGSSEIPTTRDMFFGMLHDIVAYCKHGRLVRAFPTFHVFIVDEGRNMSYYRLWDNLYGLHGIQSIDIHKSRKNAADTCVMMISNLYGNLSAPEEDEEHEFLFVNYFYDTITMEMIGERLKLRDQLRIETGCRLHIRLGYGSDISSLPIVFNGVITELSVGDTVQLIAQGDGIELTNVLPVNEKDTNRMTNYGNEPRNIILEILADEGSWLKEAVRGLSAGQLYRGNALGIYHFGVPRWINGAKDLQEIAMNVYPAGGEPTKKEDIWLWAALRGLVGLNTSPDEPNMQFYLYDKSPWDIFQMLALAVEDYIVSVQPFELRSTLFYGKPQWPFIYGYDYTGDWRSIRSVEDIKEELIVTRSKTFQQLHFLTSEFDIIANNITASSEGVYTQVRATYKDNTLGPGDYQLYDSMTVYADTDIDPEHQRLARIHTGLVHRGWFPYFSTKWVAEMIAANALRDFLKEMYKGDLVIFGNPSLKPHDYIHLHDSYTEMYGPILVEQVVHHIGPDTGFITTIRPDTLVTTGNSIVGVFSWIQGICHTLSGIMAWLPMQHILKAKSADTLLGVVASAIRSRASATSTASSISTNVLNVLKASGKATQETFSLAIRREVSEAIVNATRNADAVNIARQLQAGQISLAEASAQLSKLANTVDDVADAVEDLHRIARAVDIVRNGVLNAAKSIEAGGELWDGVKAFSRTVRATHSAKRLITFVETFGLVILVEGLFDYFIRWSKNRQRCLIFPLVHHGKEFVAGIDGRQGAVWGDKQSTMDKLVKIGGMITGLPFLDFRFWDSSFDYSPGTDEDDVSIRNVYESAKKLRESFGTSVADLPVFHNIPNMRSEEWYDAVIASRSPDSPIESLRLLDYAEVVGSDFYRFRDKSQGKLLPAMIAKLVTLEQELRLRGFQHVNVSLGFTEDSRRALGPLEIRDLETFGNLIEAFELQIELVEYLPHMAGLAIDIEYQSEEEKEKILEAVRSVGFGRYMTSWFKIEERGCIGINEDYRYIHLDMGPTQMSIAKIGPRI